VTEVSGLRTGQSEFRQPVLDGTDHAVRAVVRDRELRVSDVLLPVAFVIWVVAVVGVKPDAMKDWGLITVLPITFFVAVGLLIVSIAMALTATKLSPVRLAAHLVVLVLMLHATVPFVFPAPNYPWVYKHIGVVGYISLHGRTSTSVDIYQNWPGFFALAAWFTKVAGVSSPLSYAKWAPVYFNLLFCLELAFAFRYLPVSRRVRWLGLFLFVAGNWVGQDYFAPQAVSLVLSLAVFAMILAWMQTDRRPAILAAVTRLVARFFRRARDDGESLSPADPVLGILPLGGRVLAVSCLFSVFSVIVVSHQLSPYLVLLAAVPLAVLGLVRPRWVVAVLGALAIGYLLVRLSYLHRSHYLSGSPLNPRDILAALSNPFDNTHTNGFAGGHSMPGRAITALAAPGLMVGLWVLGILGIVRRLRAKGPILLLSVLALSPALLALGQNYGGEAIFRIYLFSLPWTAVLGACFVAPRRGRWGPLTGGRVAALLTVVIVLFMAAFWGSVELYRVRPGDVTATQYFFDHAPPGSVLDSATPNVPARLGGNYDLFLSGSTPPPLTSITDFQHRMFGPEDVAAVSDLFQQSVAATTGGLYLSLSADQQVYAQVVGLLPKGSLVGLDLALSQSPHWQVFYRNQDAVIFRYLPT
jgi:hypothetical protein